MRLIRCHNSGEMSREQNLIPRNDTKAPGHSGYSGADPIESGLRVLARMIARAHMAHVENQSKSIQDDTDGSEIQHDER